MKKHIFIFIIYLAPILFLHGAYANEGLDSDLAILKINKVVKSLNKEILSLKDDVELIKENEFVLGNYDKAINLFINFAKNSPNSSNIKASKLWLARAYSANESYLKSKDAFLDYQSGNKEHSKYADSMFELAKVLIKLNEVNEAKLLLLDMIKQYPGHSLINKANQLFLDL